MESSHKIQDGKLRILPDPGQIHQRETGGEYTVHVWDDNIYF